MTEQIAMHEVGREKGSTPTSSNSVADAQYNSDLAEYERSEGRPVFFLNRSELKLLSIAGVGFFLDAYDLFIINVGVSVLILTVQANGPPLETQPVSTMLQYRLYGGGPMPANLEGLLKAGANIGSVIGQFAFGYAADALGRKAVYGKELMLIILATILTMTTPTGTLSPNDCLIYLSMFRILLGVGVGGDYPMSASVTSDRANLRKRGTMLAYIFSNQGWGSLVGSLVTIIVLACYRHVMDVEGKTSKVDGVWRIVVGLSLIPAFGTLYYRLTMPESTRFLASQKLKNASSAAEEGDAIAELKKAQLAEDMKLNNNAPVEHSQQTSPETEAPHPENEVHKKAHFKGMLAFLYFLIYFSEWRHAKLLIGTSVCWFLLDIAFYGINLNQNVVLEQIGFDGKSGTPWERLFKISTGNIIITALGFVPGTIYILAIHSMQLTLSLLGYWVSVLTIEKLGRKWIQIQGFLLSALFLAILAGRFKELSTAAFIACILDSVTPPKDIDDALLVFPTRYRATAHGISAAAGKCGAIISALAFNVLSEDVGTPVVLWSKPMAFIINEYTKLTYCIAVFFGCCIAGASKDIKSSPYLLTILTDTRIIVFTLLLPEVKGRDPDLILAEEMREKRAKEASIKPE
ncbi:hypothetical protein H0H92_005797 [Tricholoma furcatifolium]|nr:hypothetical protein H0H92_005797 [Tricholoma furcatifolium]